jgi:hypothetical protein
MRFLDKIKNSESTEVTLPKAQLELLKIYNPYDYSIMAAANANMRFTQTNDIVDK